MAVGDIGYMLFVELLGMTQYPGAPFTANIIKDLILFLFIPAVFILIVVYLGTSRIISTEHAKMRLLLSIAAFLFILVSGYYPVFAYIAGVYFIFFIFIIVLLFFFVSHFKKSAASTNGGAMPADGGKKMRNMLGIGTLNPSDRDYMLQEEKKITERIRKLDKDINNALKSGASVGDALKIRDELDAELQQIRQKLKGRY